MDNALRVGAQQAQELRSSDGWHSMECAPRDGTWVEIKNTYGVAPSYSIARWTDERVVYTFDGQVRSYKGDASWQTRDGSGFISERPLHWRPYGGNPGDYVDPTGGAQNDMAYWRGAIAATHGLPLNYFEKEAARNSSWWRRLVGAVRIMTGL